MNNSEIATEIAEWAIDERLTPMIDRCAKMITQALEARERQVAEDCARIIGDKMTKCFCDELDPPQVPCMMCLQKDEFVKLIRNKYRTSNNKEEK